MTAASDYLEAKLLDDYFVNATVYLALFHADTGEDDAPAQQINVPLKVAALTRNANRATLSADVTWSNMPEDVDIGAVAILTAATNGHVLVHGSLTKPDPDHPGERLPDPKHVTAGQSFTLPAGALGVTCD